MRQKIHYWLKLGTLCLRMRAQSMISYNRSSFITMYIAQVGSYFGEFVAIWAMMRVFQVVNGWSIYEVLVLYSLDLLAYACAQAFVIPLWRMDELVGRGGLDEYLVRPFNPLALIVARGFNLGYLAHVTIAGIVLLFSLGQLGIVWGLSEWLLCLVVLLGATLIQIGLTVAGASLAFWWTHSYHLAGWLRWDARAFIRYPLSIYPRVVQVVLTFIVPVAFINYYPAMGLLDKPEPTALLHAAPGVALAVLAYAVWQAGLRRYTSTGS